MIAAQKPKDFADIGRAGGKAAVVAERQRALTVAVSPTSTPMVDTSPPTARLPTDFEADVARRVVDSLPRSATGIPLLARGDHGEVAGLVASAVEAVTGAPVVADLGAVWRYDPPSGIWVALDADAITRVVARLGGLEIRGESRSMFRATRTNADGVARFIAAAPTGTHGPGFFAEAPDGVAATNGFVGFDQAERRIVLRTHAPDHRARTRLAIAYAPDAVAPTWSRVLGEWFDGDADARDKQLFLQEFCGVALLGAATRMQRAAFLAGDGANGKSVFVEVASALFSPTARTNLAPQDLAHIHTGAGLAGSRLNVLSECPERAILDSEGFKAVVAGDEVTRRHVHGRPFTFRPRAAHLIAANRLPPVGDGSHGFWRRVVVVGFGRRFDGSPDLGLATRIVADELGGVLAWALTGAARALVAGRYTLPASSSVAVDEWRVGSDAVAQWLDARTDPVTETWRGTAASAAYADFRRWAADNGHRLVSQHTFGARLKPLISCAKSHGVMTYALTLR